MDSHKHFEASTPSPPKSYTNTDESNFVRWAALSALVVRGLILSRFPMLHKSTLRLLERSVLTRRRYLLSPRKRFIRSSRSERATDSESSDVESPTSVLSPSWDDYQFPEPPETDGDAETGRCEWCHDEVHVSQLKDSTWWR